MYLMLQETDKSTNTVRDFKTHLPVIDRTVRKKISKNIENLNDTIKQLDLVSTEQSTQQE